MDDHGGQFIGIRFESWSLLLVGGSHHVFPPWFWCASQQGRTPHQAENQKGEKMQLEMTDTAKAQARGSIVYVIHRDIPNNTWNVYKRIGIYEDFEKSFPADQLSAAQDYCNKKNGVK